MVRVAVVHGAYARAPLPPSSGQVDGMSAEDPLAAQAGLAIDRAWVARPLCR